MKRSSLLQQLPLSLVRALDLDDVLRLIARDVMDALDYEDCVIYVHEGGERLVQRAAWGPKSPNGIEIVNPLVLTFGEGIVGAAARCQQTQLIIDTNDDPRYISDVASCRSELAVPIVFEEQVLGVIDSEHTDRGFFTEDDAEFIAAIAAMAAARMHSAISTRKLEATICELHETQVRLEHSVETDPLTGIGNRRHFVRHLDLAVASGRRFGVCAIDLDRFKEANDFHGHHQGDHILRRIAEILSDTFKHTSAIIARVGGDEFVVLDRPASARFASLCLQVVTLVETNVADEFGIDRLVTASAGVAFGDSLDAWGDADDALFVAKGDGGNSVRLFDANDAQLVAIRQSRSWTDRIRRAMSNDGLMLVAQAIGSAHDLNAEAEIYEVLLRFQELDGQWVSPVELLDVAARLGFESEIDRWVLNKVIEALVASPPSLRLAVNWSVASLSSPTMTQHLLDQLEEHRIDPDRLVIEVTEHGCITSPSAFKVAVQAFREAGVRVSIDDLGSGWTSLKMMRDNPVDFIKLDGQWVTNAVHDELSSIAVKSMIDCAHLLGAEVIAEWVEDQATLELMAELGAEFAQGWLVHRPVALDDLVGELTASTDELQFCP